MEYSEFGVEQQEALLKQRIAGWEADHFGHEINKQAFSALPDGPDKRKGLDDSILAQQTLESSITSAKVHLEKVKAEKAKATAKKP